MPINYRVNKMHLAALTRGADGGADAGLSCGMLSCNNAGAAECLTQQPVPASVPGLSGVLQGVALHGPHHSARLPARSLRALPPELGSWALPHPQPGLMAHIRGDPVFLGKCLWTFLQGTAGLRYGTQDIKLSLDRQGSKC